MKVSIEMMKEGKEADEETWSRYLRDIDPDHKEYMPYARWLAWLIIKREDEKCDGLQ